MKYPGDSHRPQPPPPPPFLESNVPNTRNPSPGLDLRPSPRTSRRPARRRPRTPATRLRRNGAPNGRRSRPETPLSKWKIHDWNGGGGCNPREEDEKPEEDFGRKIKATAAVSTRKLAAGLWRLQLPEAGDHGKRINEGRLGLQHGIGHLGLPFLSHQNGMISDDLKNPSQSLHSLSGTKDGHFCELELSFQLSSAAMEGTTKWDPICLKKSDEAQRMSNQVKLLDQKVSAVSVLEAELDQARVRIQELETECHSSKKKLEHLLKKVSEEKALWRNREHGKIRACIDDIKAELSRERKSCQRFEIVNSRLVDELTDAKLLVKHYMQEYEKERKARVLIEEVCDELAKEIGDDKAEVEVLKRESMKIREEVEEERRMLQMAEVWREERVQMKLIDAKVALDQKYSQMNKLVADLESFLKSKNLNPNVKMKEAQSLKQVAATVNIQDIKGFSYEPSNPADIFAIFEDVNFGEPKQREIEPFVSYSSVTRASKIHTVSPEADMITMEKFQRHLDVFTDDNGDIEDESGWETVSHVDDQDSSCSQEGIVPSVTKNERESNVSGSSVLEWEGNAGAETPTTEVSEVCSVPTKQSKKVSSIARLWRSGPNNGDNDKTISVEGMNGSLSNGKGSNGGIMSPDWGSGKGGLSPQEVLCHLSSPESGNSHNRGMNGCIPCSAQKNSLKARLLEARMESQKVQLRHVLKQKV